MTWAVVWSLAGTAVCPSLWFTKRKTPTLPTATCTFSCLFPNHPVATSPLLLLLLRLFVLKGWAHPCQLWIIKCTTTVLGVWQAKCKQVSFRLFWTPRPPTRAHMVIFWSIPDAQPFSVSLSTAVLCVLCVLCVCPRSKPHVFDGKGGRLSSKKRLPAFILVRSLFPVMDLGSTF